MTHRYFNKTQRALLTMSLAVLLGTTAMTASFATQALAQDTDEDEYMLEEIVVTGSRIVRRDFEATSPIVTVDEQLFDQSATLAIETQLNKLPQFTPTIDIPTSGGDIQPTARNTPGEATVALRGLGANRSLVLINGRRGTPSNGMGVLDINTIPVAAIERVEAISGGASSTYGADAMAGVINFIMKEDFVGLEVDAQAGITQEGDNFESQVSGVMGADFAGDRGNVMLAFSYNKREDARQGDRKWYRENWANPAMGATQFFPEYTGANLGYANLPDPNVLNTVMGLPADTVWATDPVTGASVAPGGATYYVTKGGQVFAGFDYGTQPGIAAAQAAGIVDGYSLKLMNNGYIGYNNIRNYLIFPMNRSNIYTNGTYEINDWLSVFMQGYFSKVHTNTVQEPGPITSGWSVNVYPDYNRDVIPDELLQILDSRTKYDPVTDSMVSGASDPFSVRAMLPVPRETLTDTTTFNIIAGLEGKIPGIDWSWEAFVSQGEAETYSQSIGYTSLQRTRMVMGGYYTQIMLDDAGDPVLDPFGSPVWEYVMLPGYQNFGEGFEMKANPQDGGFGAATATCTSGLNPFDWSSMTPDCWQAIMADVKTRMLMEQDIWEANLEGPVIELPAGEMRGALGISRRENTFKFLSDNLNSEGMSFNDTILGLYPAQDSFGSIEVKEYYGELLVPILKDLPFMKQFNLELGARRSDYDTTGVSHTYKALADWRVNDWIRFRGGYNRAERAPNIGELYLNPEQTFGVLSYGDVCSLRNRVAPTTANPATNPEWYEVVNLCGQLMDKAGDNLDINFYGAPYEDIVAYGRANAVTDGQQLVDAGLIPQDQYDNTFYQTLGGFGFLWPINIGNEGLEPEKADTWTFGFVIDSPFENRWLSNFRVAVDYYQIEIKNAIGEQSADVVMYMCVDPAFNPSYDPNAFYCQGFNRDARFGTLGQVWKSFFNGGRFKTSGIDINISWSRDAGPGIVMVNSNFNWLLDKSSAELPSDPMIDYTGTFGPNQNGLNGNSYEYRAMTTVGYAWGNMDASIRWQYYSSIDQSGVALGRVTSTGAPPYNLFDLLGNYQLTDDIRLRFGIENVFNTEPPLIGENYTDPNGMTGGGFRPGIYDTNGRRFYLGARMYF
jgi:iron complex outermembrane receptor protein